MHNSKNSEEKAEDMPHALGKLTPAMGKLNPAIGKLNPAMGNLDPARGKLNPAIGNIKKPKSTNNAKTDEHNDIEWF